MIFVNDCYDGLDFKEERTVVKFDNWRNRKIIQKYETVKLFVKIQSLK